MRKPTGRFVPRRGVRYIAPARSTPAVRAPVGAPARATVSMIAELMQKRPAPTRSREEQAFIDLQRGYHQ
jgi:hypothetical protein